MKNKMNNKGFSLVELIIVIAIMAVIVGIAAPQYLKYLNNSKISTDVSNAQEIATVVNTLVADSKLTGTTATITPSTTLPAGAPANDLENIMVNLGKPIIPKYEKTANYIVTYSLETGVSKIIYKVDTTEYEVYPNPDNTTNGLNTKKK